VNGGEKHAKDLAIALHGAGQMQASGEVLAAVEETVRDAIGRVISGDERDDMVQEAMLRLTIRFGRWDPTKGTFPAWAATVATNLTIDCLRRDSDAAAVLGEESWAVTDDVAVDTLAAVDDADLIDSIFDRLIGRHDSQALKVLAVIQDLVGTGQRPTHAAVAGAAQVSESTVRRALTRIRAVTRELGEEM